MHSVVVVMKMGRASHASRANAHVLSYLFSSRAVKTHGVLVLTHWEGDLGNEDRDLADWNARDPEMQKYCRQFSKVILTNNQLQGRGAYPECRQKCLEQLCSHVASMEGKIKARPVTPREIFVSLLEKFGDLLWGSAVSLKSMVLGCQDEEVPTYCGECAVCLQNMEIRQACKLVCHHSFHNHCIGNLATCPVCRAEKVTEWQYLEMFLSAAAWLEQFNCLDRKVFGKKCRFEQTIAIHWHPLTQQLHAVTSIGSLRNLYTHVTHVAMARLKTCPPQVASCWQGPCLMLPTLHFQLSNLLEALEALVPGQTTVAPSGAEIVWDTWHAMALFTG